MDFKKVEIKDEMLSKIAGGFLNDPCCTFTVFADGSPSRDDDEDCDTNAMNNNSSSSMNASFTP